MKNTTALIIAVLMFAAGSLVGWTAAQASAASLSTTVPIVGVGGGPGPDTAAATLSTPAANTRLLLNSLFREHTVLAGTYLTTLYDGGDTTRLQQQLEANTNTIAGIVESVYGTSVMEGFVTYWRQHLDEYWNYVAASRNDDMADMNTARANLNSIAVNIGNVFDQAGTTLDAETITRHMMDHSNGTLALVDAHADGDTAAKADLLKNGYDQAGIFADSLVHGMVSDVPDRFQ